MRWLLIDQFTEIRKSEFAKGVKAVTRAEGAIEDSFPAYPVMPPSLMLEMMAQVGGVLVGATVDFAKEVVLAKISDAEFAQRVVPPAMLEIEGRLTDIGDDAARTECRILQNGEVAATANIFFGLFGELDGERKGKIVFSDDFMKTYVIREIMRESSSQKAVE